MITTYLTNLRYENNYNKKKQLLKHIQKLRD